ncbi:hypothetical protein V5799_008270 [Amblyomma americanum]|uniref:Transposable element P transposase-like RNase H domain-containing protein n=1 Tax=Amblyomma americanum TaxID=6943 RepID=A0AAQ4FDS0_AMBAM
MVLPGRTCLKKYLQRFKGGFGLSTKAFDALNEKTKTMDAYSRHGGLVIDEIKLSEHLNVKSADNNLQGRWKSLRDTFTKKHHAWKAGAPSGSGAADAMLVKWPYFHMMFLKDQVDIGSTFSDSHVQDGETAESALESIYSETRWIRTS